ncbi:MAG: DUF5677 domain-containing protein [Acidobacteriia bacterium]|nr:DUF5677 domain-containing protein [Terriglobia bacterium]
MTSITPVGRSNAEEDEGSCVLVALFWDWSFGGKYRMPDTMGQRFSCGFPEEWEDFAKRHRLFLERFPNLVAALNTAFIRRATLSEHIDKFIFFYGRLCCEDFFEVGLCCGNGYGAAAMKLVRSLYERAVTLRYLHEHPEELTDFWDYHHVSSYKLMVPVDETLGTKTVPEEMRAKLKTDFERVKERFMVTACDECGTKRLNHTWSKLDFVSMSKKTGVIGKLVVPGYYWPLRHAHATVGALLSRLEDSEVEGISFAPTAQRKEADDALMTAQNIIVDVLNVQDERFKIPGLSEQIQHVIDDFGEMYAKPAKD